MIVILWIIEIAADASHLSVYQMFKIKISVS